MFRWLGALFSFIGRFGCRVQIAALLFLVALLLALLGRVFGFTLDDVDGWLAKHGGFFSAAGDVLFRVGCGFVLLCCVAVVLSASHGLWAGRAARSRDLVAPPEREVPLPGFDPEAAPDESRPFGVGCTLAALVVGYVAWVGTFR